jgi:hypothetical protein
MRRFGFSGYPGCLTCDLCRALIAVVVTPNRARCLRHWQYRVVVEIEISSYPPHRSGQAGFPHPALASGGDPQAARGIGMADMGRGLSAMDVGLS